MWSLLGHIFVCLCFLLNIFFIFIFSLNCSRNCFHRLACAHFFLLLHFDFHKKKCLLLCNSWQVIQEKCDIVSNLSSCLNLKQIDIRSWKVNGFQSVTPVLNLSLSKLNYLSWFGHINNLLCVWEVPPPMLQLHLVNTFLKANSSCSSWSLT